MKSSEAPRGRSLSPSSLSLMSSNCLPVSSTSFCSSTITMATLVRVFEVILSILGLPAIVSSTRRVTSCSILSAEAPGQVASTAAARTGMSGSLRWGIA
jgi:hypothetical protein